eukprot:64320-Amphidinium_carterae.1
MEKSRPTHANHLVHVKAGTQNYSTTSDFSNCKCQSGLAFHAVRSLHIIQYSHGWLSMLDSLKQIPTRSRWSDSILKNLGSEAQVSHHCIYKTVLCQHSHHVNQKIPVRLERQWSCGIWIGIDTSNGNPLTLTSEGLIKKCQSAHAVTQIQCSCTQECSWHTFRSQWQSPRVSR